MSGAKFNCRVGEVMEVGHPSETFPPILARAPPSETQ